METLFKHIAFRGESSGRIKRLPGFASHHRLPEPGDRAGAEFVQRVGEGLLRQQGEDWFAKLRQAFGYRRRELTMHVDQGLVDLTTPDFGVHLSLTIDTKNPRAYVLATVVEDVTGPDALYSDAFATVFEGSFDRVVCVVRRPVAIEDVIDRVEDHEDPGRAQVQYPADASSCVVSVAGMPTKLCFERDSITLLASKRATVGELLDAAERLPAFLGLESEHPLFGD